MTALIRQHRLWQVALALVIVFAIYWGFFAADRYVSTAHVLVDNLQAQKAVQIDVSSLLSGPSSGGSKELLLLRDYLLSSDMLRYLDGKLNLREHYSTSHDLFSRMWSKDMPLEWFHNHYLGRVEVLHDEFAGLLMISAQAYTPEMAHAITTHLVREGERFMNELAQKIAREQVAFAEKEAVHVSERVVERRKALVAFQNTHGLVSPSATVENLAGVVARLEGELATLQARRRMLESYLSPGAPDLVQVTNQTRAIEQQIAAERSRLAAPKGKTLNILADRYERLVLEAQFAQDIYRTALTALEQSRLEATRTLKKVSVVRAPTQPEYATEPRRTYNIAVFVLGTLLLTGILHLIITIIREHRD